MRMFADFALILELLPAIKIAISKVKTFIVLIVPMIRAINLTNTMKIGPRT